MFNNIEHIEGNCARLLSVVKLEIKIREMALGRGIMTAYQLQKRAMLAPSLAAKLYRNELVQVSLITLSKLCEAFDCDVGDLLIKSEKTTREN